jgi:hypothetical protein
MTKDVAARLVLFILMVPPFLFGDSAAYNAKPPQRFTLKVAAGIGFPRMSKPLGPVPGYWPAQTVGIDDFYQDCSGSIDWIY